jgi:hypothetical protein
MTAYSMRKPEDWQAFERAIRALVACVLGDPNAQMNGRQCHSQHGIDVYGRRGGDGAWIGVQCKQRLDKPVTARGLREELEKAKRFQPPIAEFVLATTAPRDAAIQEEARRLTEAMRATPRPIIVSVWGWEDVEERAGDHPDVNLHRSGPPSRCDVIH